MRHSVREMLPLIVALLPVLLTSACVNGSGENDFPEIYTSLDLETRLQGVDFSLIESDPDVVSQSWQELDEGRAIPMTWELSFAGADITIPPLDPSNAVGIMHSNGRMTTVYLMPDLRMPGYGEIVPLALAHYRIPDRDLDIVMLLVCFQADPDGSHAGIGVRSVDREGFGFGAPFALALKPEDLMGKFFYDEFIAGASAQRVAARAEWDMGFMLITRLSLDAILSAYVPWY